MYSCRLSFERRFCCTFLSLRGVSPKQSPTRQGIGRDATQSLTQYVEALRAGTESPKDFHELRQGFGPPNPAQEDVQGLEVQVLLLNK